MGTKNNPGQFDCYANAAPDEPMFVLLGRDRHAAGLVQLWALLRARAGEDPAIVTEALECAKAMRGHAHALGKLDQERPIEDAAFEAAYLAATKGMTEHPEGFDSSCQCDLCNSYAEPG